MDYIETAPPIDHSTIEDMIKELKSINTKQVDGTILSAIVQTCYEFALKKHELINITVADIATAGAVNSGMKIGKRTFVFTTAQKKMLQDHIDYLNKAGYGVTDESPLFPGKNGRPYDPKNLNNHLGAFYEA
jgi:integrase